MGEDDDPVGDLGDRPVVLLEGGDLPRLVAQGDAHQQVATDQVLESLGPE